MLVRLAKKHDKSFDLGQYGRFSLTAALFNVTNTNALIRRNRAVETITFNQIEEDRCAHVTARSAL